MDKSKNLSKVKQAHERAAINTSLKAKEDAVRCPREQRRIFNFPELPERVGWASGANIPQMQRDWEVALSPESPAAAVFSAIGRLRDSLDNFEREIVLRDFGANFDLALDFLQEKFNLDYEYPQRFCFGNTETKVMFGFLPSRRGDWRLYVQTVGGEGFDDEFRDAVQKACDALPEFKRKRYGYWVRNLGKINDLATFKKSGYVPFKQLHHILRHLCAQIHAKRK